MSFGESNKEVEVTLTCWRQEFFTQRQRWKRPRKLDENNVKVSACIVASVLKWCYKVGILGHFQIAAPWPKGLQTRNIAVPHPTKPKPHQPKPPPNPSSNETHTILIQKKHLSGRWGWGEGRRGRDIELSVKSVLPVITFQGNKSHCLGKGRKKWDQNVRHDLQMAFLFPFHSVSVNLKAKLHNV